MNVRIVLFVLTTLLSVTSIHGDIIDDVLEKVLGMALPNVKDLVAKAGDGVLKQIKELIGLDKLENITKQMEGISADDISALVNKAADGLDEMVKSVVDQVPLVGEAKSIIDQAINIRKGAFGVMSKVVEGVCGSTIWSKVTIECRQLTVDGKESTCCPTCDLIWPETVSVILDAGKERTLRNMLLAMGRYSQIVALTIGGLAGAVPFVGDVAANPANAIVSALDMVLPSNPSEELVCMREQFFMMKEQMDRMETMRFEIPFHTDYMAFRKKLSNLKDYFDNMNDAVNSSNCASQNDVTCEAVQMWRSHCNWTDPSNDHEDPNHLFQELHTLVTRNLFGPKFLQAASMADNKFEHLFQVYFSITTDMHGLKVLNNYCGELATPSKNSKQRSSYAKKKASQIQDFLNDFLMQEVKSKVEEDTKKLHNATKESSKNWSEVSRILVSNQKTPQKGLERASAELGNQYPIFRTDCSTYNLTDGPERNKLKHDNYYKAPNFHNETAKNMSISYEETRIHIIDNETICYTFIPVLTLESITNNLEYLHCNSEYKRWLEKTENKIGVKDWKPTSPFCEEWRDQTYFLAEEERRKHWIGVMEQGAVRDRIEYEKGEWREKLPTQW